MSATLPSPRAVRSPLRPGAPDHQLAAKAAAGDALAFEQLYDRYAQRVFNLCDRILGSGHDAADATQDTFIRVLKRLPDLDLRETSLGPYLFTAARHVCFDLMGPRARVDVVDEVADGPPVGGREAHPATEDPERSALIGATQEDVRAAFDRLNERHREVLHLREVEELSYDQIGAVLGMNANAVAQLISRARLRLRDELRGSALASIARSSEDCARATTMLSAGLDDASEPARDTAWLVAHLRSCDHCRLARQALAEAGRSYRLVVPLVPLELLRRATLAKAAEPLAQMRAAAGVDEDDDDRDDERGRGDGGPRWRPGQRTRAGITLAAVALLALVVPAATSDEQPLRVQDVREAFTPPPGATTAADHEDRAAPRRESDDDVAGPALTQTVPLAEDGSEPVTTTPQDEQRVSRPVQRRGPRRTDSSAPVTLPPLTRPLAQGQPVPEPQAPAPTPAEPAPADPPASDPTPPAEPPPTETTPTDPPPTRTDPPSSTTPPPTRTTPTRPNPNDPPPG